MKKETFTFPDYSSMWSFKEKTNAINVRIETKKNRITGLFNPTEIDMALNEFRAVNTSYTPDTITYTKTTDRRTSLEFNFKSLVNKMSLVTKNFFFSLLG
jgi:hypothetical protein